MTSVSSRHICVILGQKLLVSVTLPPRATFGVLTASPIFIKAANGGLPRFRPWVCLTALGKPPYVISVWQFT